MVVYNKGDQLERQTQFGETSEIPVGQPAQQEPVQDTGVEDQAQDQAQQREGQRKDRAKKRIQQLSSQKNAAEQEAANYKRMYEETLEKMQTESKTTTANLKTTLEQQYNVLLQQMGDAIRAGEADKVVQCQDAMVSIKIQLDKINTAASQSAPNRQEVPAETPVPRLPELAKLWIEDHPAFNSDELFHNAAITVNNQLLREGYDSETEEFYDLLSARLSKRFPESFGTPDESMVQYRGEDDSTVSDSAPVAKQPAKSSQVRTQEQIVSGSARPSANTIRSSKSSSNQVTFTQQEAKLLDAWGLDKEKIAKRIQHNESNSFDGYVPIFVDKSNLY